LNLDTVSKKKKAYLFRILVVTRRFLHFEPDARLVHRVPDLLLELLALALGLALVLDEQV